MSSDSTPELKPTVSGPTAVWSWCLYDFANSPFTTLVVTFVYATFFTEVIASDSVTGTAQWSRAVTITALLVAALSPVLGAFADRGGFRKPFLAVATVVSILATVGLFFPEPGQVLPALVLFVVANVAFEVGLVFYNAFLPDITPSSKIGRVSGYGWALGYAGGLLALVVALFALIRPETPMYGFSSELGENVRATNLLVAAWFGVFSLPLFLFIREDRSQISAPGRVLKDSWRQLKNTFVEVGKFRQIVRFLVARLVYNDALVTIFAFGGIYAAGTFGFDTQDILVFGIVLNVTAGFGAFVLGYLDDVLGGKRTIQISLVGLILATALAIFAPNRTWFWVAGILVGVFSGPNQSASRSLMGRFVPPRKENEFFGFFAFSGKLTAFLGPAILGILTQAFDSQRAGISIVLVLFVIGFALLLAVDEEEGIRVANRED